MTYFILSLHLLQRLDKDGQFLITSDRDEKVRVSHYPNAYNIGSYCLGHEEYVEFNSKKQEVLIYILF